jgi:GNAT superfamily N-acetyltransferase
MTHTEIHRGTGEDATEVAFIVATAFASLEVAEWLVPDPTERVRVLRAQTTILVEDAFKQDEVLLGSHGPADSTGFSATAVWYYQPTGPLPPPHDYEERLAQACGKHTDRFRILDQAFADCHPATYPHHYLAYLATLPDHQGRGLGSALLRHTHRQLDGEQIPAFLVASNARTRDVYERHGYECLGDPFYLPDGPPMWPMWREPHSLPAVTVTDEAMSSDLHNSSPRAVAEQPGGTQ